MQQRSCTTSPSNLHCGPAAEDAAVERSREATPPACPCPLLHIRPPTHHASTPCPPRVPQRRTLWWTAAARWSLA